MGWLPGAVRRDVGAAQGRFTNGLMAAYLGVVMHVNDADSVDLYGWITGDNGMSCHWQLPKDRPPFQYIDTAYSSWCQSAGNDTYLSAEAQGFPTEPLNANQVYWFARIMAWCHDTHGIPLVVTDTVGQRGLIAHGDGGPAWGGHPACPGELRKAQRPAILTLAAGGAHLPTGDDMPLTPGDLAKVRQEVIAALADPTHHYMQDELAPIKAGIADLTAAVQALAARVKP